MEWKKVSERIEKIGYKKVTLKDFEMPDGEQAQYTTWGTATNNAAVIALTPEREVIVARQFRPGPERILDELPGGAVEVGEDPTKAAERELLEETGYTPGQPLKFLGVGCRDAYTSETNYYYLALDCYKIAEQSLDDYEYVAIERITIDALIQNAKTAHMSDGIAVLMAYEDLQELK